MEVPLTSLRLLVRTTLAHFLCVEVVSTNEWPALGRMVMGFGSSLGEMQVLGFIGFSTLKSR